MTRFSECGNEPTGNSVKFEQLLAWDLLSSETWWYMTG